MPDDFELLLSQKQLKLLDWIKEISPREFSRKDAIEALNMPPRTVEASIKKIHDLGKLQKLGQGRATRYRLIY